MVKYYLNKNNEFVIENYNFSKPFANFFPGIAGKYGIPMWVFYVNRAQAISCLGTKDKDHSIVEFFPANKAWQQVSTQGFRTFIKISSGKETLFYEPFHNGFTNLKYKLNNNMRITSYGLTLEENNLTLGLNVKVEYFSIPNESYAGLARIVTIKNLKPTKKSIQLCDGLPQIVPYGTANLFLKKLGRTIEAWMKVRNLEKGVPFYKLDVDPTDRPEIIHIKGGNFYLGFHYEKNKPVIIKPIVDPECLFGPVTDLSCPQEFLNHTPFKYPKTQITTSKTPCGFLLCDFKLDGAQEKTFYSVIGNMRDSKTLNSSLSRITSCGYINQKKEENKKIIEGLQGDIDTKSASREFDLYAKQTYLDNILRGGYPVLFTPPAGRESCGKSTSVFYLYSRKHGDLERDYNKFQLQPAYFSQGNGNYRDMNQNRRSDIWFNPDIKDDNLVYFLNLLQTDGFNPLVIKGASFAIREETDLKAALKGLVDEKDITKISGFLSKPFTPGDLIFFVEENNIKLATTYDEFLTVIISCSIKIQEAEHGEGFWTDHWVYNLDLLESFFCIFPENFKDIVFEKRIFTYYDNTETVRPRAEKYMLYNGSARQLHSVVSDAAKKELIKNRPLQPHVVRTQYGAGAIYQTTLINKLLCLLANKLASLDPAGVGIEMEANKPNWFDALNGLPALFGSSLCETFELKRLVLMIGSFIDKGKIEKIYVAEEVYHLLSNLNGLLKDNLNSGSAQKDYEYWDKSYSLKEDYRHKTKLGVSGVEIDLPAAELKAILVNALNKINAGIEKAKDKKKNVYYSYFINEVTEYEKLHDNFIKPLKFKQSRLPLYLEGQMHALRLCRDTNEARSLCKATKSSELFDAKLKSYKVTAPLASCPEEIGRCRIFTPGWLENESIWLHMEYKYILEILKRGLIEEFYSDFKNTLIAFQDPRKYGRSILENSSFLVSSVFPDKNLHGNGFVARLSGSTAEFLEIWLAMNVGIKPFFVNDKSELNLRFSPALAGWLFNAKDKTYSFNFLGKIRVVYHNPKRKDTFGKNKASIKEIAFNDKHEKPVKVQSDIIPSPYAEQIRSRQVNQIDIYLN